MADQACASCGASMPGGAVFCTQCGSRSEPVAVSDPAQVVTPQPDQAQADAPQPEPAQTVTPSPDEVPADAAQPGPTQTIAPPPDSAPAAAPQTDPTQIVTPQADSTQIWDAPPVPTGEPAASPPPPMQDPAQSYAPPMQDPAQSYAPSGQPQTPPPSYGQAPPPAYGQAPQTPYGQTPPAPYGQAAPPGTQSAPAAGYTPQGFQAPASQDPWTQQSAAQAAPAGAYGQMPAQGASPVEAKGSSVLGGLIGIIGGAAVIAGSFLSWMKITPNNGEVQNITGMNLTDDAKIVAAIGAVAVIFGALALLGQVRVFAKLMLAVTGIAAIGMAAFDTYDILNRVPKRADIMVKLPGGAQITAPEIGLIVIFVGGAVLLLAALLTKTSKA